MLVTLLLLGTATLAMGQRPFFAGSAPIGYPEVTTEPLANRFGSGTTQKLPIEANGDRDLVDRLSKLPQDQQPFWLLNWQQLEDERNNPQTFPSRPSSFTGNSNLGNSGPVTSNSNLPAARPPVSSNPDEELGNRFGSAQSGANVPPKVPSADSPISVPVNNGVVNVDALLEQIKKQGFILQFNNNTRA